MTNTLKRHPDFACAALTRIEAEATRAAGGALTLRFVAQGGIADVALPAKADPVRADELWRHTCFEAFVRADGNVYYEFNFAPSTSWAAYRFTAYRDGMANANVAAPRIEIAKTKDLFELRAVVKLPRDAMGPIALAAVIEETNGNKSYWALAHPPGKPDFHHQDGFVLKPEQT